ncbi:hypothetical protein [Aureivirga sp. CE67]|uniref:hypothetical protein n=1 Tax=Aureivirga sp. CE67 TaxID=1788983 RepID=UPI0018CAD469|nr:hypothetical protein [Aureivirga sp. CE67]
MNYFLRRFETSIGYDMKNVKKNIQNRKKVSNEKRKQTNKENDKTADEYLIQMEIQQLIIKNSFLI